MISQLIRQPNVWLVNQHYFVNQNEIADCFSCLMGVLVAESVCEIEESSLCSVPEVGSFGRGIAGTLDCFSSHFLDGCQWLDIIGTYSEFDGVWEWVFDQVLMGGCTAKTTRKSRKSSEFPLVDQVTLRTHQLQAFARIERPQKKIEQFRGSHGPQPQCCNLQFHATVVCS